MDSRTKENSPTAMTTAARRWGLKLRAAASDGNASDVVEILEDARYRGEDAGVVNMPDRWGYTPAISAAMFGHTQVLEVLMARGGADLSLSTMAGETALHWASLNGHVEACALLLSAGSDPNARQAKGMTPLMLASKQGFHEIVQLQVDAGAECSLRDYSHDASINDDGRAYRGRTALDYAIENGHEACVNIFRCTSTRRIQLQYLDKRRECEDIRLKADALQHMVTRLEAESDCLKDIVAQEEYRIRELEAKVVELDGTCVADATVRDNISSKSRFMVPSQQQEQQVQRQQQHHTKHSVLSLMMLEKSKAVRNKVKKQYKIMRPLEVKSGTKPVGSLMKKVGENQTKKRPKWRTVV